MSGGHFEYNQFKIRDIADDIQTELDNQGKDIPEYELSYFADAYLEKYPEERYNRIYRKDVQEEFKKAIKVLRQAEIYAQRVDWYLSGDDGEDSFISRLKEDLEEIK